MSSANYSWQNLYLEAFLETDLAVQRELIRAAENAILARRKELMGRGDLGAEVCEAEFALLLLSRIREIPFAKAA